MRADDGARGLRHRRLRRTDLASEQQEEGLGGSRDDVGELADGDRVGQRQHDPDDRSLQPAIEFVAQDVARITVIRD